MKSRAKASLMNTYEVVVWRGPQPLLVEGEGKVVGGRGGRHHAAVLRAAHAAARPPTHLRHADINIVTQFDYIKLPSNKL